MIKKNMKKTLISVLLVFSMISAVFSQEENSSEGETSPEASENEIYTENVIEKASGHKIEWMLLLSPMLILNTEDVKYSAPSPIVFPFSAGIVFPAETKLTFQPRISLWANYLLWYDGNAYPAEIENRTATAFNLLFDLPAVYKFPLSERHLLEAGGGVSMLLRFAKLSNGLDEDDEGYCGTAGEDVDKINSWFWKNGNFLYVSAFADYLFVFTKNIKAGPEFRFYLPVGSLASGRGMNNSMYSFGFKVRF